MTTIFVNPTGADGAFTTISAAVAAANTGDTIQVAAGTYAEFVNVNKTLTLLGPQAGVDARTRDSVPPSTEAVLTGATNGSGVTTSLWLTANNIVVDGFTVQGTTNGNQFAAGIVMGSGTGGHQVQNNIIQDNIVGLHLAAFGVAATVISQNVFQNNNQPGPASGSAIYSDQFVAGKSATSALRTTSSAATPVRP